MSSYTTETTTTLVSKWIVTANPPIDSKTTRETLSEVDEWLTKSSHWLGFSLRFNATLNIDVVKRGLERTLFHFPALGARVDTNNGGLYQLVLDDPNNQGVVLEYYKGICGDGMLPDDVCTRKVWKEVGLDAPGPGYSGEASLQDPLMRARLVVFQEQQVSFLCIGINHGLCDGSGICDILQVWSHYCTNEFAEGLPDLLKRKRSFGHRVVAPINPASSLEELYSRMESDIGCKKDPFSLPTLLFFIVPRAIWCMSRQQELELRVSSNRLQETKQQVSAHLPPGEWVSSFEVLCAVLLLAEFATSGDSSRSNTHNLNVACNLRGRADRFPKDYFGNAAFDFRQSIQGFPTDYSINNVVLMAQKIHAAVRTGLQDPESICTTKDWFEAARQLGIKNKYDVWAPVVMDALAGEGSFVNAWDKRWLDVNMGSSEHKASAMAAFFGTLQNLIIQVPRDGETGDSTIYLALPPVHAKKFREFCQEKKNELPFGIVEE